MTRLEISAEEAARHFLRSGHWASLMETDCRVQPPATDRIALLFMAPWPDVGRTTRAISLLDKELRRATAAWSLWRDAEAASDAEMLAETRDLWSEAGGELWPVREYRDHLLAFPSPIDSRKAFLRITAVQVDPFAVLLEPHGGLVHLLTAQPASSLAYAMSAFGQGMHVRHHWHARLDAAHYSSPAETLRVLLAVSNGEWPGTAPGVSSIEDDVPGRPVLYRAVHPSFGDGSDGQGRAAAVLYAAAPGEEGSLVAIRLHERATSIPEYLHIGRTDDFAP